LKSSQHLSPKQRPRLKSKISLGPNNPITYLSVPSKDKYQSKPMWKPTR
jgi:hypothetical protein